MALTLIAATAASTDTGWTQLYSTEWTDPVLTLTQTGTGRAYVEIRGKRTGGDTPLFAGEVSWAASGSQAIQLPTFVGKVRLSIRVLTTTGTIAATISDPTGTPSVSSDGTTQFPGAVEAPTLSATESISAPIVNGSSYNPTTQATTFPGAVVAPVRTFATIAEMNAVTGSAHQRVFLTDPLYDATGDGIPWIWDPTLAIWVRELNYKPYKKLGCGPGSGITFVPTTSLVEVPFPARAPNGGIKKIARGLYRATNAAGSRITPGWRVRVKIDWANVSSATAKLNLNMKVGSTSLGAVFADCSRLASLDTTNGSAIIIWAEWEIHPNGPNGASSFYFDTHCKIRYGACNRTAGQTQVDDYASTNWHYSAVSDGTDAEPIHNEIIVQCSYGGQAGTVYFDTLSVEEL